MPRFLLRANTRLEAMSELILALGSDVRDRDRLEELMRHFHALAGLGGTYGFPAVSSIASDAEVDCGDVLASAHDPLPEDVERWRAWLAEIRSAFEITAPDRPLTSETAASPERSLAALLVGSAEQLVLLARDLRQEGVDTTIALTPAAASAAFDGKAPELLIVDTSIGEAAYRIVERLRSEARAEERLAFLVGTSSDFEQKVEAVRCGADAHFELPLQRGSLMHRVKQAVGKLRSAAPRVLYVEDDPFHAAFVSAVLGAAGNEVRVCAKAAHFEQELTSFRPELVLMDVHFEGDISGYDLARYLRQDERYAATPVLFFTTSAETEGRLKSMQAGGDDFIVKPASAELLRLAVSTRIERARLLKSMLERDGLTGLLNHSAFLDRAKVALAEVERYPAEKKALVMIDIDHFKGVNDRFGHAMGDRVLASLGALLRRRLRQTDAVGRYGGEEFGIVLHHLNGNEAMALIERLLAEFRAIEHVLPGGGKFRVTFSAGVGVADPAEDIDSWKKRVDDALYVAKRSGRNRVSAADTPSSVSPDEVIH